MTDLVWLDGTIVPRAEARVSVDDFAVRYGAACFETMLALNGIVFHMEEHLARLTEGLRGMGVTPPDVHDLASAVESTLAANWMLNASVRLTVTAGRGGAPDLAATSAPFVIVTVDVLPPAPLARNLRIASTRIDAARPLRAAKTAQFLPYLLARAEARAAGADDAVLLNHAGHIVEAATANIFAILGGQLVTPPLADGALPGITRADVLELSIDLGARAEERSLTPEDLSAAEAILLTSSVSGIVAAASLAGGPPASALLAWRAPGRVPRLATDLAEAYAALVTRACEA
ncbi:MAG: 2-keto-4-methylthiobutyrate aminotransferase [Dehalococcoidia bacterium]|nr:2-keto-4-methylthiobutyrate aminotransferase [Dehalococcoidia bacterium]